MSQISSASYTLDTSSLHRAKKRAVNGTEAGSGSELDTITDLSSQFVLSRPFSATLMGAASPRRSCELQHRDNQYRIQPTDRGKGNPLVRSMLATAGNVHLSSPVLKTGGFIELL